MANYKQVILLRDDLKLSRGKASSQVAHAAVEATLKSDKGIVEEWKAEGAEKVILKVKDLHELLKYHKLCKAEKIKTALIKDAGRTAVKPGTITCLGIGPDKEYKIDKITGKLKLV